MSVADYLPLFVIAGYALAGLTAVVRGKVRKGGDARAGVHHGLRTAPPAARRWYAAASVLTGLLWLLVAVTTVTWVTAALDLGDILALVGMFVVAPVFVVFAVQLLGSIRRRRAGGDVSPIWPRILFAVVAAGLLFTAALLIVNPLLYLVGLGDDVLLTITDVTEKWTTRRHPGRPTTRGGWTSTFDGVYTLAGIQYEALDVAWYIGRPPFSRDDVLPVTVMPGWPGNILVSTSEAGVMIMLGLAALIPAGPLAYLALRERKPS